MAILAVIAGDEGWEDIENYGLSKQQGLYEILLSKHIYSLEVKTSCYTSHGHNLRFLTKSSNLVKSYKEEARED